MRFNYFQNWIDDQKWLNCIFNIDRNELHFVNDKEWKAKYEIELVFNSKYKRLGGDFWQRTVIGTLKEYRDSIASPIPENAVEFRIRVIDIALGKIFETRKNINPEMILSRFQFFKNGHPITEHNYELYDTLIITYDVLRPVDSIVYRITSDQKQVYREVKFQEGLRQDSVEITITDFKQGHYKHSFQAYGSISEKNIVDFYIKIPFYYSDKKYLEKVEQLRYIANPDELGKLKETQGSEERKNAYYDFWRQKDPTPGTRENELKEEYLNRIDYAEKEFGMGDMGWRSDRGRIYVEYGPPDEIDSHPFEAEVRAYEVWYYYGRNLKFIFVDRYGFGRYELVYPEGVRI